MRKTILVAVAVLVLGLLLRVLWLGAIPVGLSWDEAAVGYNGYGIWVNRRDEWLERLPLTFKSFGDYKAPLSIYLNSVSTAVFGLTPFAIRLPAALAGTATIVATMIIAYQVGASKKTSLLAGLLFAVSPWSVHFSRIAFESSIAVMWVSWGVIFFLAARKRSGFWLCLSAIFFSLSLYTYHSPKIALPVLGLLLLIYFGKRILRQWIWLFAAAGIGIALLYPLVQLSLTGSANARLYMTSVVVDKNGLLPLTQIGSSITQNIRKHLDPGFLFFGKTMTYRHGNGVFGVLTPFEVIGLAIAIVCIRRSKSYVFLLGMVVVGFLPALVTTEAPHANRAQLALPYIQILAAMGITQLMNFFSKRKLYPFATWMAACIFLVHTIWMIVMYKNIFTTVSAQDFQYGYLQAVQYAVQNEHRVEKVYFTSEYGQPYIFILLGKKLTPMQYQQGALANYVIRDLTSEDLQRKNVLLVGTPQEIPTTQNGLEKEILFPDGTVAFRIVRNQGEE